MILYKYFDKRAAAEAVLKDYKNMQFILDNTDNEIAEKIDRMYSRGSSGIDGMPKAFNPGAFEDRIIGCFDDVKILEERYRQAKEYMYWVEPVWEALSNRERRLLDICYMRKKDLANVTDMLMDELCIAKTRSYYYKKEALDHFTILLFGA